jgi:hypothetical protein
MAACNFNLLFTFIMVGWEGAAHDTRIFLDAIRKPSANFPKPPPGIVFFFLILLIMNAYCLCISHRWLLLPCVGKYYLVDAGYLLIKGYLTPYKGERYHIPDFRRAGRGNGIEERFNYVHSSLRSVIERTFGVWKNRWHILRQMSSYDFNDQMLIVVATAVLHNFIRIHDRNDKGFKWDEDNFDNDDDTRNNS